jgi:putative membrane protein
MSTTTSSSSDRPFFVANAVVSVGALSLLAWLLLFNGGLRDTNLSLRFLPPVNACFNALAACLLVAGRLAIRAQRRDLHRSFMIAAFVASSCFLVGYLAYHSVHGDTKFGGEGALRTVYLSLLASHVLLSVPVVPLALTAFYFAWKKEFVRHTKVTRVLHPIWLYVSVTGVVVYALLRPYYPA